MITSGLSALRRPLQLRSATTSPTPQPISPAARSTTADLPADVFAVDPSPPTSTCYRSPADELVNTITHGAGLVLALVGALVMAATVWSNGDAWRVAGCGVFLVSLVAVYAASTFSHGFTAPRWKELFRRLDQGTIYLLIVATYTPFALAYLRTPVWTLLLAALWIAAALGFFAKVFFAHRLDNGSIWTYVVLGWLQAMAVPALWHVVPFVTAWWMFFGGICYMVGTFFLIYDARVRHFHAIWHLLVIAGSTCHFLGIFVAVARAAN